VRAPPVPAEPPEDVSAWQRLLLWPEQGVTCLQFVQALERLQHTAEVAHTAAASCNC
jgi:hypothetical protein